MDNNFRRLLALLSVLQRGSWLSTQQLHARISAQGFDVTPRTLQRDLEDLAKAYPLESDRASKPFRWRWHAGTPTLSMPGMGWSEVISFYLLDEYLDGVLPTMVHDGIRGYVVEARRRIQQHAEAAPLRQWTKRVRVVASDPAFAAPKVLRSVHEAVTEAVLSGRQLQVRYQAFGQPRAKIHVVSPLGLLQYGSVFYLPVRFAGFSDVRTLTLHRVQRAVLLEAKSEIDDFDLDRWIAEGAFGFGGDQTIKLDIRLFDNAGLLIVESPLSRDQQVRLEAEGVHRIAATVLDTQQLRRWLQSLGARVEVIAPSQLRAAMVASLQQAFLRYGTPFGGI